MGRVGIILLGVSNFLLRILKNQSGVWLLAAGAYARRICKGCLAYSADAVTHNASRMRDTNSIFKSKTPDVRVFALIIRDGFARLVFPWRIRHSRPCYTPSGKQIFDKGIHANLHVDKCPAVFADKNGDVCCALGGWFAGKIAVI